MGELLRALAAMFAGAIAAMLWLERQTSPRPPPTPEPAVPPPSPEPERVIERIPDPEQAERIASLEAELAAQRAIREPAPDAPHPGVDAIRAARARALELELQLSEQRDGVPNRWFEIPTPSAGELLDLAAVHMPRVAIRVPTSDLDSDAMWKAVGAMQEFAEASGGAWFDYDGDFARWCAESAHHLALDPDLIGVDDSRPTFAVERQVNRSGQMVVPTFVTVGEHRCYYVDDVAGETGRMHIVGVR